MANVTVYRAVTDAPTVKKGMQQIMKHRFSITKSAIKFKALISGESEEKIRIGHLAVVMACICKPQDFLIL